MALAGVPRLIREGSKAARDLPKAFKILRENLAGAKPVAMATVGDDTFVVGNNSVIGSIQLLSRRRLAAQSQLENLPTASTSKVLADSLRDEITSIDGVLAQGYRARKIPPPDGLFRISIGKDEFFGVDASTQQAADALRKLGREIAFGLPEMRAQTRAATLAAETLQAGVTRAVGEISPWQVFKRILAGKGLPGARSLNEAADFARKGVKGEYGNALVPREGFEIAHIVASHDTDIRSAAASRAFVEGGLRDGVRATLQPQQAEADVLSSILRAGDDPKLREGLLRQGTLTQEQDALVDTVSGIYRDIGLANIEEGTLRTFAENYAKRKWQTRKLTGPMQAWVNDVVVNTRTRPTFALQRSLADIATGEAKGLKLAPGFDDAATALGVYVEESTRAAATSRALKRYASLTDPLSGLPAITIRKAVQTFERSTKVTSDYVSMKGHTALEDVVGRGQIPMVHSTMVRPLKVMLDADTPSELGRAMSMVNAVMKRFTLAWSMFHVMALTESNFAVKGFWRGVLGRARGEGPFQQAALGNMLLASNDDLVIDALRGGLDMGSMIDFDVALIQEGLGAISGQLPILRGVRKFNQLWDRGLWDFYHRGLKLSAFAERRAAELSKFAARGVAPTTTELLQMNNDVARYVNSAYGGLNWRRMLATKQAQRWLRFAFLAPDWTSSNLMVATPAVLNTGLRGDLARGYALRAGVTYAANLAMLNFVLSGHWPWQNPVGKKGSIELPFKDEQGRRLFMKIGKQFNEPFQWLAEPPKTFSGKMGALPKAAITFITGRNHFGRSIVDHDDGPVVDVAKRLGYIAQGTIPIPLQQAIMMSQGKRDAASALITAVGIPVSKEFIRERRPATP